MRGTRGTRDAVQSDAAVSLVMAPDGAAAVAAPCDLGLCPPTADQDARRHTFSWGSSFQVSADAGGSFPPLRVSGAGQGAPEKFLSRRGGGRAPWRRDGPGRLRVGASDGRSQAASCPSTLSHAYRSPPVPRSRSTARSGSIGVLGGRCSWLIRSGLVYESGPAMLRAACPRIFSFALDGGAMVAPPPDLGLFPFR